MWKRTSLLARTLIMGLLAIGFLGTGSVLAQSGEICSPNPALALADSNGDGVLSLGEIDNIISLAGGDAELQAQRDRLAAAGITGIRYTGCDPNGGSSTATGTEVVRGANGQAGSARGTNGQDGSARGKDGQDGSAQGTDGQDGSEGSAANSDDTASGASSVDSLQITTLPIVGVGVEHPEGSADTLTDPGSMLLVGMGSTLVLAGWFSSWTKRRA